MVDVAADGRIVTMLRHRNEEETPVDGFQEAGSFLQNIVYDADADQIEALINRSSSCWQRLSYTCRNSRLFNSPCKYTCTSTTSILSQ